MSSVVRKFAKALGAFALVPLLVPFYAVAADDSVTVSARFYPAPGHEAEAEAYLLKVVSFVHREEPSTTFVLHRSLAEPTIFFFYEVYPSQAAREVHAKGTLPAFGKQYGPPPTGTFIRPPEVESYRALAN